MKKYLHRFGIFIVLFGIVGLPVLTIAEEAEIDTRAVAPTEEEREQAKQVREETREKAKQVREIKREQVKDLREMVKERAESMREGSTTPVRTREELKWRIEERRMKVRDEAASSTPEARKILEGVAPMRVAVHALLSSRDLLGGGIGDQVSEIARHMNDSVASTTDVEAQIVSRGFLKKLLFGGDKKSAEAIRQKVEKNKERMQELTGLLSEASTTADIKAELGSQVQIMREEQDRLQSVAESQSRLWGFFSWRLF